MGAAKEWGLVLALGAAAFGAGMLLGEGGGSADAPHEAVDEVAWAFRDVTIREPGAATVLGQVARLAPGHDCPEVDWRGMTSEGGLLGVGSGNVSGRLVCWSAAIVAAEAWFNATTGSAQADFLSVGGLLLRKAEGGPFLGEAGHNATRVTVHAFDAAGELVFSNGNASEQARLTRTLTPEQLPTGTWYLGANATAPPGTQRPPLAAQAFLPQVRHLIQGLPVGGVATMRTDALATWYGTLFVTVRVDGLVHAP